MIGIERPNPGIPFIRAYSDGTYKVQAIQRPAAVDVQACRFIALGGRFFIAIISDLEVRLCAMQRAADGNLYPIADETCMNGPPVLGAVDRLVERAAFHVDKPV